MDNPLEKTIESRVKDFASDHDWLSRKWVSPNHRFVPDQIFFGRIPPEHQEIVAKYIRFVEFKRAGNKPTPGQEREHQRLRDRGFRVIVIDSVEQGKEEFRAQPL